MPLQIIKNNITEVKADAVVSTVNEQEDLHSGQATMIPAFELDARFEIHTVGPVWEGGMSGEFIQLKQCYENSLRLARMSGCESVAFPLISTGTEGFPKDKALLVAMKCISHFLLHHDMEIFLVVLDKESFELTDKVYEDIDEYITENYTGENEDLGYKIPDFLKKVREEQKKFFDEEDKELLGLEDEDIEGTPEEFEGDIDIDNVPAFASIPISNEKKSPIENGSKNKALDNKVAVGQLGESFQQRLLELIDEHDMTDVEVYKQANIDKKLFENIRGNIDYQPAKKTAAALVIALRLNIKDAKDLLKRAGYTLCSDRKFDLIIEYCIRHRVYNIYTINMALFQHDEMMLGE